jgi:hypothetical protein
MPNDLRIELCIELHQPPAFLHCCIITGSAKSSKRWTHICRLIHTGLKAIKRPSSKLCHGSMGLAKPVLNGTCFRTTSKASPASRNSFQALKTLTLVSRLLELADRNLSEEVYAPKLRAVESKMRYTSRSDGGSEL